LSSVIPREQTVNPKRTDLLDAIRLIERQVAVPGARFAIANEGSADESSLMGTRDGLLNLVLAVLRLTEAADEKQRWDADGRFAWDGGVNLAMHQIPSLHGVWLVGAYLFRDHATFMEELRQWVEPKVADSLLADPAFVEPPAAAG
jgi:hypothetical protein